MKQVYNSIEYKQGPYKGGLCAITIMPVRWLAEKWVANFKTGIVDDISILPGYEPITISLVSTSYDLSEKPKTGKAGSFYEIALSGLSNDIDDGTMLTLQTYRYEQWMIIFKDLQHRTKIAGNLDAGFTFAFSNDERSGGGGEQRINVSFELQQENPALFFGKEVEEIVVVPKLNLPGSGEFDVSLNEDEDGLLVYFGIETEYPAGVAFTLERSTVADFSSDVTPIVLDSGHLAAGVYNDTSVIENVTYYYRMKATKAGYADSDWAEDSGMVPATALLPLDDLWLDMDSEQGVDTTVVGPDTFVDKWTDQVNGFEFTPFDANKAVLIADGDVGTDVVSNGNNSGAWLANLNGAQRLPDNAAGMTIYIVGRQSATNDMWGRFFTSGSNVWIRRNSNENKLNIRLRVGVLNSTIDIANDTFFTIRTRFDGTNQFSALNNGAEVGSAVIESFWTEGATGIFSTMSNKRIARILVYRRNHTEAEMNQVEDFLQTKYGHY